MARLNKPSLISKAIEAIGSAGWVITRVSPPEEHPARFVMEMDGVSQLVRLYIWNLSPGGRGRLQNEYRLQVTGVPGFALEPSGKTLILGWRDDLGVFAGFDAQRRLGPIGASPSIQIRTTTLNDAYLKGAALQPKSKGEWAVALEPKYLAKYVKHLELVHDGDIKHLLTEANLPGSDRLTLELNQIVDESVGFDFNVFGEADLREEVVRGVDNLLKALGTEEGPPPAMGHNHPPEPMEEQTALASQIIVAANDIKVELGQKSPDARRVGRKGALLAWAGRLLEFAKAEGAKVIQKSKDMAHEYAAKALWGTLGSTGVVFKEEIVLSLRNVANAVLHWLQHITIL